MQVILSKLSGFCGGVNNTITKAKEEILNTKEPVYCLGQIVHNEEVIKELESLGMITVDKLKNIPNNSKVIIRAHGEPQETYNIASQMNLQLIDLTCPKIKIIREKIYNHINDSFIIIIGKKNHPETIGNLSYCKENGIIIETSEDIIPSFKTYKNSKLSKVYIISQTTFSMELFDKLVEEIKKIYQNNDIIVDNTICNATENRQKEVSELSKKVNKMIIIGGKNSSNTKELFNIAKTHCEETYLIQNIADLSNISFTKKDIIGIAAGASTPKELMLKAQQYIINYENSL